MEFHWSDQLQYVKALVLETNQSVFITGKAGTGKSTLIKKLIEISDKKTVVLAPTGIAALNCGGSTIHSFFQFPLRPLFQKDKDIKKFYPNSNNSLLIKNIDTIIIDEVSMVRADIIDAIDYSLQKNTGIKLPFGGKQMVFIGDMMQLDPVISKNDAHSELWDEIYKNYKSAYFFDAKAFKKYKFITVELIEIYRQKDNNFLELLNEIREGNITKKSLNKINERCYIESLNDSNESIILTTTNNSVECINNKYLDDIEEEEYHFKAIIRGSFDDIRYPADKILNLKVGAQIMFLKNSSKGDWVNGTIGTIIELNTDCIIVKLKHLNSELPVYRETWENKRYKFSKKKRKVESECVGDFTQFPVRLAWAITIHKSQGITLDEAIIDFGNGTFTHGQAYVALSRLKSIDGLKLNRKIKHSDIITDKRVIKKQKELVSRELLDDLKKSISDIAIRDKIVSFYFLNKAWYCYSQQDYAKMLFYLFKSCDDEFKIRCINLWDEEKLRQSIQSHTLFNWYGLKGIQKLKFLIDYRTLDSEILDLEDNRIWWDSINKFWKKQLLYNLGFSDKEVKSAIKNTSKEQIYFAKKIEYLCIPVACEYKNLNILYSLRNLKVLSLDNEPLDVLNNLDFSKLTNLEVLDYFGTDVAIIKLSEIKKCKQLSVLNIPYAMYDDYNELLDVENLEYLNLHKTGDISGDQGIYEVLKLPKLKKACIDGFWVKEGEEYIYDRTTKVEFPNIKSMDSYSCRAKLLVETEKIILEDVYNQLKSLFD